MTPDNPIPKNKQARIVRYSGFWNTGNKENATVAIPKTVIIERYRLQNTGWHMKE
jgi:hypothetical protein